MTRFTCSYNVSGCSLFFLRSTPAFKEKIGNEAIRKSAKITLSNYAYPSWENRLKCNAPMKIFSILQDRKVFYPLTVLTHHIEQFYHIQDTSKSAPKVGLTTKWWREHNNQLTYQIPTTHQHLFTIRNHQHWIPNTVRFVTSAARTINLTIN